MVRGGHSAGVRRTVKATASAIGLALRPRATSARRTSGRRLRSRGVQGSSPAAYRVLPPGTWQPAQPQDAVLKGKWWEIFHEPELDVLEEQLDINNQTIAQYFQNFMAARAQVDQARAGTSRP